MSSGRDTPQWGTHKDKEAKNLNLHEKNRKMMKMMIKRKKEKVKYKRRMSKIGKPNHKRWEIKGKSADVTFG